MNTVVFSILRLCPPVPGARAALLYVGGRPAINWRLFGRGGTPPRIPRAMGRRHGKGSMPPLECRSWEASGRSLVGGNPDFTDAPAHGDDDARFYDRQQAYVHARAE